MQKILCAVALLLWVGNARADLPGKHPAYLHALSDLRSARAHLERPAGVVVKWDEKVAIREIDAAIKEIKDAAIDDGKPLSEHPPVDVAMDWTGRLQKALELVERARADVDKQEDNEFARGLKARALGHMAGAAKFIREGIEDSHGGPPPGEGAHPAYLHALTDLRAARAWLARPAGYMIKWDENQAIREIDGAIKEIKLASIDDGKPIDDHPPVDAPEYGNRLQRAIELLNKSRADINEREDDKFARGLKRRALKHIDGALAFVQQGLEIAETPNHHPAYMKALSDLRYARALLPNPPIVTNKWDSRVAFREIEAAIKEIKEAAIEDGKPMDEHPAIDAAMEPEGRLQRALDLVSAARGDVDKREDDKFARGLKKRAMGHLDRAMGSLQRGLETLHQH